MSTREASVKNSNQVGGEQERSESGAPSDSDVPWYGQRDHLVDGPPCWPLLQDPFGALTDRARWPKHLCDDLMCESTATWIRQRFLFGGVADFLSASWPMPIGRVSLQGELKRWRHVHLQTADALSLMPCDGDEYSALILSAKLKLNRITVFGLVTRKQFDDPADVVFLPSEPLFQILGNPTDPAVLRFVRHTRAWWKQFGRAAVLGGRPVGTVDRDLDIYLTKYRQYVEENERRPSMDQFVEWSGIPRTTMKRQWRSWGIRWLVFKFWDLQSPFPR